MAANLFLLPFRPALDANALVVAGAKLYFYASRTSTPQAVYSDEALTTPLSNPVTADAAGAWPSIYLDKSLTYRVVVKDAEGNTLPNGESDPYIPGVVDALAPQVAIDAASAASSAAAALVSRDEADLFAQALLNIVPGVIYTPDNGGIAQALIDTANGETFVFVDGSRSYIYRNNAGSGVLLFEDATQAGVLARLGQTTGAGMVGTADGNTVQDVVFRKVNLPAVLGSQLGIGYRVSYNGADARYLGGMWPATNYCAWLFEAKFTAANTPGSGESPASTAFFYAENDGSEKDVLAGMFVAYLKTDGNTVFSTNHIATGDLNVLNGKYVCAEFDVQPANGSTVNPNSLCLPINAFNHAIPTAMQIGAVGGGSWNNGAVFYNVTSACIAGGAGATLGSLFNTGTATYTGAAGIFSNDHALQFSGTASSHFTLRCDGSNNLRLKMGGGAFVVRDVNDISSLAVIGGDGSAAFGVNASASAGYKVDAAADIAGDGIGLFRGRTSDGVISAQLQTATGTAGNAAACTLNLRANGTTTRAVNAGGTINASGADYAEYELLGEAVTGFAKGDIVGFDANGLLTDRFADAVRFGIKSTNPNLVGGDSWADEVPEDPERPEFVPPRYEGVANPGPMAPKSDYHPDYAPLRGELLKKAKEASDLEKGSAAWRDVQRELESIQTRLQAMRKEKDLADELLHAEWEVQCEQFAKQSVAHDEAVERARAVWTETVLADWHKAVAELYAQREALRARVERIAYCGKVPVNAPTGKSGDYLIPCDDGKGGITARVVARADLADADSLIRLGSINRTLADGRPEVVVHVG